MIYPNVYVTKSQFDSVIETSDFLDASPQKKILKRFQKSMLNYQLFGSQTNPFINFVIIRDLRDTLVSLFFSMKVSHVILTSEFANIRNMFQSLGQEEGLVHVMNKYLIYEAKTQLSWINSGDMILKYEDLIANEHRVFKQIIKHCQSGISHQKLNEIISYNSFKAVTGREPGQEDISRHQRKGIAGDWKNYFSDPLKNAFKKRYGDVLIKTGYEKNLNW